MSSEITPKKYGMFGLGDGAWPETPLIDGEEFDTEAEALAYIANMNEDERDFYTNDFVLVQSESWYPNTRHGERVMDWMHEEYASDVTDGRDNRFLDDSLTNEQIKELEEALDAAIEAVVRAHVRPATVWQKVREINPEEKNDESLQRLTSEEGLVCSVCGTSLFMRSSEWVCEIHGHQPIPHLLAEFQKIFKEKR
jgi:rubrerythrin